jgi:DNA repair exonuclease SbcCD nuclease subunit
MKILCGPDLHIRATAPEHRIDDFVAAQKHKIKWLLKLATKNRCKMVLFPGDLTDHSRLPYYIVDHYIRIFKNFAKDTFIILTVRGQHDMLYHVESQNTPYSVMDAGGAISHVGGTSHLYDTTIGISGVDFDGEIQEVVWDLVRGQINILLIHKMFVDDKLWEGQEEYERANIFLTKNKWDLIVSGDNHQHFMFQSKGRFHVNCGSLMRQNIDQKDHQPVVYIYDTEDKTLAPHYVPIDPIEDVMDLDKAETKKERSRELEVFVEKMAEETEITGLDFLGNLKDRLAMDDIDNEMREIDKEVTRNASERISG